MELVYTTPSAWQTRRQRIGRRVGQRLGPTVAGLLATVAAMVALTLLLPGVLGLSAGVVRDVAMGPDDSAGWWHGSLTLAVAVDGSTLRPGDVIAFLPPSPWAAGGEVVRRVVAIEGGVIATRGDAALADDPWTLRTGSTGLREVAMRLPLVGTMVDGGWPWWLGGAGLLGLLGLLVGRPRPRRQPAAWRGPGGVQRLG